MSSGICMAPELRYQGWSARRNHEAMKRKWWSIKYCAGWLLKTLQSVIFSPTPHTLYIRQKKMNSLLMCHPLDLCRPGDVTKLMFNFAPSAKALPHFFFVLLHSLFPTTLSFRLMLYLFLAPSKVMYKVLRDFFSPGLHLFESEVELNGFLQVLHVWSCSIEFLQSWYMLVSLYSKLGCWVSCLNNLSLGLFSEKKQIEGTPILKLAMVKRL